MALYRLTWKTSAEKDLRRLPREVIGRLITIAEGLMENPFPPGVRKLSGTKHTYRLRSTDRDSAIVQSLEWLTGLRAGTVSFLTEGPFLNALGIETVVCGPADSAHWFIERGFTQARQVTRAVQIEMISETQRLVERATRWFLRRSRRPLDIAAAVKQFGPAVQRFGQQPEGAIIGTERQGLASSIEAWKHQGVPQDLAEKSARLRSLVHVLDISEICVQTGIELGAVGTVYRDLGERLKIDWLQD